jgi:squalene-hopene/tetraprenyl-beta-curcumene cyclase
MSYQKVTIGRNVFLWLDGLFKWAEKTNLVPFRQESLKAAEKWVIERQEDTGDWGELSRRC